MGGCSGRAISAPPCPCMVPFLVRDQPELSSSKRPLWRARLGCATSCWHPCTSAGAKQLGESLRSLPGEFGNIGEGRTRFSSEHGWSDATPTCRARPGAQRSTWLRRHQEGTSHGDTSAVGTRNVWRVPPEHPKCGRGSCLSPGRSEQCRVAVERGEVLSTAQKAERQVRRQQLRHHFCSLESIFFSICSKV